MRAPTPKQPSQQELLERLQISENRYRVLAENARDVIWTMAPDGAITYISSSIEQVRGLTVEEAMAQTLDQILTPPSQQVVLGYFQELAVAAQSGQPLRNFKGQLQYYKKDGSVFWTEVIGCPVVDKQGRFIEIIGLTRDVSERKAYEDALVKARDEAQQANLAKGELLARMTHELKTPLHAILGFADVLQRAAQAGPSDDQGAWRAELLQRIKRNGDHLLAVVKDMLEVTRLERGAKTLRLAEFEVAGLIDDMMANAAARARDKGLALKMVRGPHLPVRVTADRLRLMQIAGNLLDNAIKFTARGGITVRMDLSQASTSRGAANLVISVEDTGRGVPSDDQERIFSPFFQAGGLHSMDLSIGLGLAISRSFAELMGGCLELDVSHSPGSRFVVEVPVTVAPQVANLRTGEVETIYSSGTMAPADLPPASELQELRAQARLHLATRVDEWMRGAAMEGRYPGFVQATRAFSDEFDYAGLMRWLDALSAMQGSARRVATMAGDVHGHGRVLVVDDEADNLRVVQEMLRDTGVELCMTRDPQTACSLAEYLRPDLILLDVRMPRLDGYELCRQLKSERSTRATPVIFLSALEQPEDRDLGMLAGAADYISKPFDIHQLMLRVSNHLPGVRLSPSVRTGRSGRAELYDGPAESVPPATRAMRMLIRAREHVLNNLTDPPDLVSLARYAGTNRTTLQALFRKHLGTTVYQYVKEQRLQRARQLLETGAESVESVAVAVGYASGSELARAFGTRFGLSPAALTRRAPTARRLA